MSITIECPACGKASKVPDSAAGLKGKCNSCGNILRIPSAPVQASAIKICCVCGADVTLGKRLKDANGRYYCAACADRLKEAYRVPSGAGPRPPAPMATAPDPSDHPATPEEAPPNAAAPSPQPSPVAALPSPDLLQCPNCGRAVTRAELEPAGICPTCALQRPAQFPPIATAPVSLGYTIPTNNASETDRLRPRGIIAFAIVAIVMFILSAVIAVRAYFNVGASLDESTQQMIILASTCAFLLLTLTAAILWLLWVYRVHADLRSLTAAQYSISPGEALGFSFIPLFDAFWASYMPFRLARELNRHLTTRGLRPVSAGGVLTCQIASVVTSLLLPGLMPVLYAVSMWQIQSGVNRLASK